MNITERINKTRSKTQDLSAFITVMQRFPVALVIMACVTIYLIFIGLDVRNGAVNFAVIGLTLSAYFAVMQSIWAQARGKTLNWIIQIVLAILTASLFYFSDKLRVNIWMICIATLLLLGNSVRFGRGRDDLHVWDFTHKIWTAAAFTALGCAIYLIGVMTIFYALKSLFGFDLEPWLERFLLPIGFGFLAPLYWLYNIPPVNEAYDYLEDSPSFIAKSIVFIGVGILAPLTLIYGCILLVYGVQIITQMALPNGEVALLTTPFLLKGTLTWLMLDPPFIQKNIFARFYRHVWFIVVVPVTLLLALSVYLRIANYGLTVSRILLSLICVWSLILSIWFIFMPKPRRDIRFIPALAATLCLIAAPLVLPLSIASQSARFEKGLKALQITDKTDNLSAAHVKGALKYLWRHNAKDEARRILSAEGYDISEATTLRDIHTLLNLDVNIPSLPSSNKFSTNPRTRYVYYADHKFISVSGYDYAFGDYNYRLGFENNNPTVKFNNAEIVINNDVLRLKHHDDKELTRFDIKSWIETLNFKDGSIFGVQEPIIIYRDDTQTLALLIREMTHIIDGTDISQNYMRFYILAKGFEPE